MLYLYGLFLLLVLDGDCVFIDVEFVVVVGVGLLLGGDSGFFFCWIVCFIL